MIIIPRKKVKMEWWIYHHKPPIRTWQLIRAQAGPAPGHVTSVLCATCWLWGLQRISQNHEFCQRLPGEAGAVIILSWCHDSSPWLVISLHCHCLLYPQYYAEHCPENWINIPQLLSLDWPEDGVFITLAPPRGCHVVRAGPEVEAGAILIRARDGVSSCNWKGS